MPCCAHGRAAGSSTRLHSRCSPRARFPTRVRSRNSPIAAMRGRWREWRRQGGRVLQSSSEFWLACAWGIIRRQPMRRNLSAYVCEFVGTALMLFIGVSAVAFMWAPGSPVPAVANAALRRLLTGLLFAGGATAVVYSPLGQISGGHINPAVTLAFWRMGKVPTRDALIYIVLQFAGAYLGAYAAGVAWGPLTRGVQYAATVPGDGYSWAGALAAETAITFLLVFTIFVCVNKPRIAPRTGIICGSLVALLVMIEAPVTGTSLNPARTLGPAILAPNYASL